MKYVVIHNLVKAGGVYHERGTVLTGDQAGEDLNRLLDLKAIRPATAEEAPQEQVTLVQPDRLHLSYEAKLAEKEEEIGRLRAHLAEKDAKLNAARSELETVKKAKSGGGKRGKAEE